MLFGQMLLMDARNKHSFWGEVLVAGCGAVFVGIHIHHSQCTRSSISGITCLPIVVNNLQLSRSVHRVGEMQMVAREATFVLIRRTIGASNVYPFKSLSNAKGVTGICLFPIVLNSKTSGSQLAFHFIAGEPMNVTTPFKMVAGIQGFLAPTKEAAA
jgi:hypothetical protein